MQNYFQLSNPDPNVSPFSANRGNNVYDFSFTGTGGYLWVSDQILTKSKEALDKSEKRKTFWKFRRQVAQDIPYYALLT